MSEEDSSSAYIVTAILEDLPRESHLDIVVLLSTTATESPISRAANEAQANIYTYIKTRRAEDLGQLVESTDNYLTKNNPTNETDLIERHSALRFLPIVDIHLGSKGLGQMKPGGDLNLVNAFILTTLFLLLTVLANFASFKYSLMLERMKELGVRKILGASPSIIFRQFFGEGLALLVISLFLGFALFEVVSPAAGQLMGVPIRNPFFILPGLSILLCASVLILGGLATAIPAAIMVSFRPARLLGTFKDGRGALARNTLIMLQFFVTSFMIVSTLTVIQQNHLMSNLPRGIATEDRFLLSFSSTSNTGKTETLKTLIDQIPEVEAVSFVSSLIPVAFNSALSVRRRGSIESVQLDPFAVDFEFQAVSNLNLVAGRWFDKHKSSDTVHKVSSKSRQRGAIVLSENALARMGFVDSEAALGETIYVPLGDKRSAAMEIIGIVNDAHWRSAKESISPSIYFVDKDKPIYSLLLHIDGKLQSDVRQAIGKKFAQVFGLDEYRLTSLQYEFDRLSSREQQINTIFVIFSALAILISCFGLFGQALFFASRFAKEVALRKTFGANNVILQRIMITRLLGPVFIAFAMAAPFAWKYNVEWLQGFSNRITFGELDLIMAGAVLFGVSILSTYAVVRRSVLVRPADIFRS
ncbi:MAG: FtsX-like permease family protein [Kordiimonadaceae bacterium]|nr:FtsX-like permease family protein [Kordiimonadaceae bacterium]